MFGRWNWQEKATTTPYQGLAVPSDPKTFADVRAVVPDVLDPASPLAQRTAKVFVATGQPYGMVIRPELKAQARAIQLCFMLAFVSDLPGFVVMPTVAYLLDQWCVEDKDG